MSVVACDRSPERGEKRAVAERLGVAFAPLHAVLARADAVSVQVPLDATTRGLIDERALGLMKRDAVLVNVGRGGVVDEAALHAALVAGRISGAALDVFETEPPGAHPLLLLDNFIGTPHVAAQTVDAQAVIGDEVVRVIEEFARSPGAEIPLAPPPLPERRCVRVARLLPLPGARVVTNAGDYQPLERRPITSRDRDVSRAVAHWVGQRGVSPNAISVIGMVFGVAAGGALWLTAVAPDWARGAWIAAAALVQLRLAANMLDGMVAVETGRASRLGELFNEVPDRVSDTAVFVGLGYAAGGNATLGWALAIAAMFTAYVRAVGKVAGAPQEYGGPLAKPQRMFAVTLLALFCGLAPARWCPAWAGAALPGVPAWGLVVLLAGTVVTALRRLTRIARALTR